MRSLGEPGTLALSPSHRQEAHVSLAESVAYDLEGSLLEVCSCNVLCPCWIGEDPDLGDCQSVVAYHFDRGTVRGVDVSGLTAASVVYIPGNILEGNWKQVLVIDDEASDEQFDALVAMLTGELGGPLADLASLVGERLAIERMPISHEIVDGAGTLKVGDAVTAQMRPYTGPDGSTTTLHDSIFSTVPGSPAYVGKADHQKIDLPQYGMTWEFEGRNAIQSDWKMLHAE
jgi:hypothetical protein